MKKKILVVGIIFLFIGIAIAPSVASIEFSKDKNTNNDLVEITLQLCKTSGVEDHKMFITQEQDEELDRLIESFKANLNNAETREETIEIYNDMVVSLDKLGILPEGTNCKEVQQLVTGENSISNPEKMKSNKHFNQAFEKLKNKNPGLFENMNMFCLITGETTNTEVYSLGTFLSGLHALFLGVRIYLFWVYYEKVLKTYNSTIFRFLYYSSQLRELSVLFWGIVCIKSLNFPFKLGARMSFGSLEFSNPPIPPVIPHPAKGWVNTIGLTGKRIWDGSFYGQLAFFFPILWGITGFTGLRIKENNFFQGVALLVKLDYNPP